MKNCSGINCPLQYGTGDPATCPAVECCPNATPPITNADRIRAMTDEELADFLWSCVRPGCPPIDCAFETCGAEKCWLDWLKQEAK